MKLWHWSDWPYAGQYSAGSISGRRWATLRPFVSVVVLDAAHPVEDAQPARTEAHPLVTL